MVRPESPNRPRITEFVRESEAGVTPADPDFKKFSDEYTSLSFNVDPNIHERRTIGDDDIQGFNRGQEDDNFSIEYPIQRWLQDLVIQDPSSDTLLALKSTDSSDTGVSVTIRNENNTVIETVSLDGTDATTLVSTSKNYGSIRNVKLGSSTTGDVEVYVNSGTQASPSSGTLLGTVTSGTTDQDAVVPKDPSFDGLVSNVDNAIPNTHTVIESSLRSTGGAANGGIRITVVAKGCFPGTTTFDGTLEGGEPVPTSIDYTPEKVRVYKLDQPDSVTKLTVYSTDTSDTNINVTIEDKDGSTSETISTDGSDGTTKVTGTVDFDSYFAVELGSEATGDIKVEDSNGNVLTTIRGTSFYGGGGGGRGEGDLGVPTLGSGSRGSDIGNQFLQFSGTTVERPNNTALAETITSFTLTCERNLQTDPQGNGLRRSVKATERMLSVDSTIFETAGRYNVLDEKAAVNQADIHWDLTLANTDHTIQVLSAATTDTGDMEESPGEGTIEIDVTYTGTGLKLDGETS